MATKTKLNVIVDEFGQLMLPVELNEELFLQNNDWLKVKITSDYMVLVPSREVDADLIEALIHQGVLINAE